MKNVAHVIALGGAALLGGFRLEATAETIKPVVSPKTPADVSMVGADPFPFNVFDDYSWRSFIALNWPAASGAENRGLPDTTRPFSDVQGPRVWQTWKARFEIFQPNGVRPAEWKSYDGQNPCGAGFKNDAVTLSAFSAFGDFNQANFDTGGVANPLVAQNRTYVRYDVRVNETEFGSILNNKWYVEANLPTAAKPKSFDIGSTEVKAAWRILNSVDTPEMRARYYIVPQAQVYDVSSSKCTLQDVALVGFHIVTKTLSRPQWVWSTFEHVDNVPGLTTEPKSPPGIPLSFNDPSKPQALSPPDPPKSVNNTNVSATPSPMQVIRKQPISESTMNTNRLYWGSSGIKGTVWQNYMLVMTQWPTPFAPEAPDKDGGPFPVDETALGNTTMETYFQIGASCMTCHSLSNQEGHDFVMFVAMDAFVPGSDTPATLFSSQNLGQIAATPEALASKKGQMMKSLTDFFNSASKRQ